MGKINKCVSVIKDNLLVVTTLLGVGVGFAVGFGVRATNPTDDDLMWLGIIGELYLRMLKMMIVPLIVTSVISGTATLDPKSNGKISMVSIAYLVFTNFLGALIGCIMAVIIRPGVGVSNSESGKKLESVTMETQDIFADLLRNLIPSNLIQATFQQTQTKYNIETVLKNMTMNGTIISREFKEISGKYIGSAGSSNILGLIIASSLFGVATGAVREAGMPFGAFFTSATDVIMQILKWIIRTTPFGVASLIAKTIASTDNIQEDFRRLGVYSATVIASLFICSVVLVPIAYSLLTRKQPFRFLFSVVNVLMIGFATSSSAISIPESLKALEDTNRIDRRVTRFVVPLSATLGRCGSSVYIAATCIFLMQLTEIETDASKVILVIVLTTCSSLAIPSVTGASLVTVIILMTALGLPAETATLLFTLEWLLDRLRTLANLIVQALGSVGTYRACRSALPFQPRPSVTLSEGYKGPISRQQSTVSASGLPKEDIEEFKSGSENNGYNELTTRI
ncbi:putative sodium-dependent excitatory amino acid transporter glt-3 [Mizuhopecten yessoensis]|uniref:Amino acid transporter n=1 Tax=Mizuhopecten yessoensis TaxID=6573 RepID=A0A210QPW8_MIZYE|nr:putative sodium-dependent excitatory amino acid transporter glt-3 [Mizuhopecten yessoensis]OWF50777.1 Excitatory amino acid transporter 3 [Mizuhopecten yessoensis]